MGSQRTTPPQTDIFWANLGLEPNLMMVGAALEGCSLPFALRQDGMLARGNPKFRG
jgi:hypothetical protein